MIEPQKKDLKIYKGATFQLNWRIKCDGVYQDVSGWDWKFQAAELIGGTAVIDKNNTDSPAGITHDNDDENLNTLEITATETQNITSTGKLFYKLQAVDADGKTQRRLTGRILLLEDEIENA